VIKAKLVVVTSGIVNFEEEFAMHMVLPDGSRVSDHVVRAIREAYETGTPPPRFGLSQARAITAGES
jgi:hypothetical protein